MLTTAAQISVVRGSIETWTRATDVALARCNVLVGSCGRHEGRGPVKYKAWRSTTIVASPADRLCYSGGRQTLTLAQLFHYRWEGQGL